MSSHTPRPQLDENAFNNQKEKLVVTPNLQEVTVTLEEKKNEVSNELIEKKEAISKIVEKPEQSLEEARQDLYEKVKKEPNYFIEHVDEYPVQVWQNEESFKFFLEKAGENYKLLEKTVDIFPDVLKTEEIGELLIKKYVSLFLALLDKFPTTSLSEKLLLDLFDSYDTFKNQFFTSEKLIKALLQFPTSSKTQVVLERLMNYRFSLESFHLFNPEYFTEELLNKLLRRHDGYGEEYKAFYEHIDFFSPQLLTKTLAEKLIATAIANNNVNKNVFSSSNSSRKTAKYIPLALLKFPDAAMSEDLVKKLMKLNCEAFVNEKDRFLLLYGNKKIVTWMIETSKFLNNYKKFPKNIFDDKEIINLLLSRSSHFIVSIIKDIPHEYISYELISRIAKEEPDEFIENFTSFPAHKIDEKIVLTLLEGKHSVIDRHLDKILTVFLTEKILLSLIEKGHAATVLEKIDIFSSKSFTTQVLETLLIFIDQYFVRSPKQFKTLLSKLDEKGITIVQEYILSNINDRWSLLLIFLEETGDTIDQESVDILFNSLFNREQHSLNPNNKKFYDLIKYTHKQPSEIVLQDLYNTLLYGYLFGETTDDEEYNLQGCVGEDYLHLLQKLEKWTGKKIKFSTTDTEELCTNFFSDRYSSNVPEKVARLKNILEIVGQGGNFELLYKQVTENKNFNGGRY